MKKLFILVLLLTSSFVLSAQAQQASQAGSSETQLSTQQPQVTTTLRTNLLYWLVGMPNLGAEWTFANSPLGVVINGGYSPLGGDGWEYAAGGWYVAPELRYYIPRSDSFFVGVQLLAEGFNYKLSDTGYQGNLIAGGVMGGYKLSLSDTFDMDFTLGLGYGYFEYDTYYHSEGVNVYKEKNLTKKTIMPIQAGVNLIWKIK